MSYVHKNFSISELCKPYNVTDKNMSTKLKNSVVTSKLPVLSIEDTSNELSNTIINGKDNTDIFNKSLANEEVKKSKHDVCDKIEAKTTTVDFKHVKLETGLKIVSFNELSESPNVVNVNPTQNRSSLNPITDSNQDEKLTSYFLSKCSLDHVKSPLESKIEPNNETDKQKNQHSSIDGIKDVLVDQNAEESQRHSTTNKILRDDDNFSTIHDTDYLKNNNSNRPRSLPAPALTSPPIRCENRPKSLPSACEDFKKKYYKPKSYFNFKLKHSHIDTEQPFENINYQENMNEINTAYEKHQKQIFKPIKGNDMCYSATIISNSSILKPDYTLTNTNEKSVESGKLSKKEYIKNRAIRKKNSKNKYENAIETRNSTEEVCSLEESTHKCSNSKEYGTKKSKRKHDQYTSCGKTNSLKILLKKQDCIDEKERSKRLAYELPGFNWLEDKIRNLDGESSTTTNSTKNAEPSTPVKPSSSTSSETTNSSESPPSGTQPSMVTAAKVSGGHFLYSCRQSRESYYFKRRQSLEELQSPSKIPHIQTAVSPSAPTPRLISKFRTSETITNYHALRVTDDEIHHNSSQSHTNSYKEHDNVQDSQNSSPHKLSKPVTLDTPNNFEFYKQRYKDHYGKSPNDIGHQNTGNDTTNEIISKDSSVIYENTRSSLQSHLSSYYNHQTNENTSKTLHKQRRISSARTIACEEPETLKNAAEISKYESSSYPSVSESMTNHKSNSELSTVHETNHRRSIESSTIHEANQRNSIECSTLQDINDKSSTEEHTFCENDHRSSAQASRLHGTNHRNSIQSSTPSGNRHRNSCESSTPPETRHRNSIEYSTPHEIRHRNSIESSTLHANRHRNSIEYSTPQEPNHRNSSEPAVPYVKILTSLADPSQPMEFVISSGHQESNIDTTDKLNLFTKAFTKKLKKFEPPATEDIESSSTSTSKNTGDLDSSNQTTEARQEETKLPDKSKEQSIVNQTENTSLSQENKEQNNEMSNDDVTANESSLKHKSLRSSENKSAQDTSTVDYLKEKEQSNSLITALYDALMKTRKEVEELRKVQEQMLIKNITCNKNKATNNMKSENMECTKEAEIITIEDNSTPLVQPKLEPSQNTAVFAESINKHSNDNLSLHQIEKPIQPLGNNVSVIKPVSNNIPPPTVRFIPESMPTSLENKRPPPYQEQSENKKPRSTVLCCDSTVPGKQALQSSIEPRDLTSKYSNYEKSCLGIYNSDIDIVPVTAQQDRFLNKNEVVPDKIIQSQFPVQVKTNQRKSLPNVYDEELYKNSSYRRHSYNYEDKARAPSSYKKRDMSACIANAQSKLQMQSTSVSIPTYPQNYSTTQSNMKYTMSQQPTTTASQMMLNQPATTQVSHPFAMQNIIPTNSSPVKPQPIVPRSISNINPNHPELKITSVSNSQIGPSASILYPVQSADGRSMSLENCNVPAPYNRHAYAAGNPSHPTRNYPTARQHLQYKYPNQYVHNPKLIPMAMREEHVNKRNESVASLNPQNRIENSHYNLQNNAISHNQPVSYQRTDYPTYSHQSSYQPEIFNSMYQQRQVSTFPLNAPTYTDTEKKYQEALEQRRCFNCLKKAQFLCSGCKNACYCSTSCQTYHWVHHGKYCVR